MPEYYAGKEITEKDLGFKNSKGTEIKVRTNYDIDDKMRSDMEKTYKEYEDRLEKETAAKEAMRDRSGDRKSNTITSVAVAPDTSLAFGSITGPQQNGNQGINPGGTFYNTAQPIQSDPTGMLADYFKSLYSPGDAALLNQLKQQQSLSLPDTPTTYNGMLFGIPTMQRKQFDADQNQRTIDNAYRNNLFDYQKQRDTVADNQWQQQYNLQQLQQAIQNNQWQQTFDYGKTQDAVKNNQWQQQFDWNKILQDAQLTGMYNGKPTYQNQQDQKQWDWQQMQFDWQTNPNNPQYQAQLLENKINTEKLKYLPQQLQLDIQKTQAEIQALKNRGSGNGGSPNYSTQYKNTVYKNPDEQRLYNLSMASNVNLTDKLNALKNVASNTSLPESTRNFANIMWQAALAGDRYNVAVKNYQQYGHY